MSYFNLKGVCIGNNGIWVNGMPFESASVTKAKSIRIVLVDEKGRDIEKSEAYTLSNDIELKIVADHVDSITTTSGSISGNIGTVGKVSTMSGDIDLIADTVKGEVSSMSGDVTVKKGIRASSMSGTVSQK